MQCGWSTTEGRVETHATVELEREASSVSCPCKVRKRTILGEPMFEEEAGNGDTGISVPSLARAMTKDGNG